MEMGGSGRGAVPGAFAIHRCGLVETVAAAVVSVSMAGTEDAVAVGRGDGSVEVWRRAAGRGGVGGRSVWYVSCRIPGRENGRVEALAWAGGGGKGVASSAPAPPRLFCGGYQGILTEVDVASGMPRHVEDSYGGPVWGMRLDPSPEGRFLAVACDDGGVRLFDVAPGEGAASTESFRFHKLVGRFVGDGVRALCCGWAEDGGALVAGSSDGCVSVWTGFPVVEERLRIVVGEGMQVWCVGWVGGSSGGGSSVVAGDATGRVTFWDAHTGALTRAFRPHAADVLAVGSYRAAGDKAIVVSTGMDGAVACFTGRAGHGGLEWEHSGANSECASPLVCLALPGPAGRPDRGHRGSLPPTLFCGAADGRLLAFDLLKFSGAQAIPCIPPPPVRSSAMAVLRRGAHVVRMVCPRSTHVDLWQIPLLASDSPPSASAAGPPQRRRELLLRLRVKGDEHVLCTALSPCGGWIYVSTQQRASLYRLDQSGGGAEDGRIRVKRWRNSSNLSRGPPVTLAAFSADSSCLVVARVDCTVEVVDTASCAVIKEFSSPEGGRTADASGFPRLISCLALSHDAQWVAAGDSCGAIHVYCMESLRHHCAARMGHVHVADVAFHPTRPLLAAVTACKSVSVFNIEGKGVARDLSGPTLDVARASVAHLPGPALGISLLPTGDAKGANVAVFSALGCSMFGLHALRVDALASGAEPAANEAPSSWATRLHAERPILCAALLDAPSPAHDRIDLLLVQKPRDDGAPVVGRNLPGHPLAKTG